MCVVSMIAKHYEDEFNKPNYQDLFKSINNVTRGEFDALKKEVENMKTLLEKALKYDEENNEPDCYIDDKIETLKKIADLVGIDLEEVFKSHKKKKKNVS